MQPERYVYPKLVGTPLARDSDKLEIGGRVHRARKRTHVTSKSPSMYGPVRNAMLDK